MSKKIKIKMKRIIYERERKKKNEAYSRRRKKVVPLK